MDISSILTNVIAFSGGALFVALLDAAIAKPARKRRHAKKQLTLLSRLLHDSFGIYQQQVRLRELLVNTLLENQPSRWQQLKGAGYNAAFMEMYSDMNPHQRELLVMIRSLSEQGLYRLNTHLMEWVEENPLEHLFSAQRQNRTEVKALAQNLKLMKEHLTQWLDIYKKQFAKEPRHGLVFVGEPDEQYNSFPQDLTPTVDKLLQWYK